LQVDKSAISAIALSNNTEESDNIILTKICYVSKIVQQARNLTNTTEYFNVTVTTRQCKSRIRNVHAVLPAVLNFRAATREVKGMLSLRT